MPPRAPWDANAGIGVMHNRMVAPLGRFALKGAAWYQGESDVGVPGYADRLRELFAGWRRQFGPQTCRCWWSSCRTTATSAERPVAAGWAETREQQRRAVAADANAALITDARRRRADDLHPPNKLQVGLRLRRGRAGQADADAASATLAGRYRDRALLRRRGRAARLERRRPLGVELCGETQDSCRYALARRRRRHGC